MELKRINRNLSFFDIFPSHVQKANSIGFSGEVFLDQIPEGRKAIGTHSGAFHSDDALAVSMLRTLPEYHDHVVVRTRDAALLDRCDIVVDVGGVYDYEKKRFDHHQKGFLETFDANHKTKLSSAGLVFKHFGKSILAQLSPRPLSDEELAVLHTRVYDNFVEEIDGVDNGIDPSTGEANYAVTTTLSKRVKRLLIAWNEEYNAELEQERFRLAMGLMLGEFSERLHSQVTLVLPARVLVEKALDEAAQVHPSQSIILLEKSCPFMEHLLEVEKERGIEGRTLFAVLQGDDGNWRIRGINAQPGSFALRKQLLPKCLGLRDEELSKACGIPACVFVHNSGFMGINQTKEGALAMAIQSLEWRVCWRRDCMEREQCCV